MDKRLSIGPVALGDAPQAVGADLGEPACDEVVAMAHKKIIIVSHHGYEETPSFSA